MKIVSKRIVLLSLLLGIAAVRGDAQFDVCGTVITEAEAELVRSQINYSGDDYSQTYYFALKHHVYTTQANMDNAIALIGNLTTRINEVNAFYAPGKIQFVNCLEIDRIPGNWTYIDGDRFGDLKDDNNVETAIDIYWANELRVGDGKPPGFQLGQGLAMQFSASNNTLTHELGHILSLWHTHGIKNGELNTTTELVSGTNCSTRGDDVCDTPADPNSWSGCSFDPTDDDGETLLDRDGVAYNGIALNAMHNIMSYAGCRTGFSQGQFDRIRGFIRGTSNTADDALHKHVLNLTANITDNAFQYHAPYIVATNEIRGLAPVEYSGVMRVTLKPGFHATPGVNFKANLDGVCESFIARTKNNNDEKTDEQTEKETGSTEQLLSEGMNVYPNPFTSGVTIAFAVKEDDLFTLSVKNIFGQDVLKAEENQYKKGNYKRQLDTSKLPAGVYFISLQNGSSSKIQKIIKTE